LADLLLVDNKKHLTQNYLVMTKKNILILTGSPSLEHEISIITALQVLENIDRIKYNPFFVVINKGCQFELLEGLQSKSSYLNAKKVNMLFGNDGKPFFATTKTLGLQKTFIDAAILTTHGGMGEGGQLQGMLDMFKIPYFSCRSEAAAIGLNKSITKLILKDLIPMVPYVAYYLDQALPKLTFTQIQAQLGSKIILKPSKLGSSIGIKIVDNELDFEKAILEICQYEKSVLIESFLEHITEYNCGAKKVNNQIICSEIEEPVKSQDILSFDDKYEKGSKKGENSIESNLFNSKCPANISDDLSQEIQNYTKQIYNYLGCEGIVRIDYIYHGGNIYFSEINTIPGSLSKKLFETSGVSFQEQINEMIEQSSAPNLDNYKWFDKSELIKKYLK
jgi:D-alanine-D-alanine ligase